MYTNNYSNIKAYIIKTCFFCFSIIVSVSIIYLIYQLESEWIISLWGDYELTIESCILFFAKKMKYWTFIISSIVPQIIFNIRMVQRYSVEEYTILYLIGSIGLGLICSLLSIVGIFVLHFLLQLILWIYPVILLMLLIRFLWLIADLSLSELSLNRKILSGSLFFFLSFTINFYLSWLRIGGFSVDGPSLNTNGEIAGFIALLFVPTIVSTIVFICHRKRPLIVAGALSGIANLFSRILVYIIIMTIVCFITYGVFFATLLMIITGIIVGYTSQTSIFAIIFYN